MAEQNPLIFDDPINYEVIGLPNEADEFIAIRKEFELELCRVFSFRLEEKLEASQLQLLHFYEPGAASKE